MVKHNMAYYNIHQAMLDFMALRMDKVVLFWSKSSIQPMYLSPIRRCLSWICFPIYPSPIILNWINEDWSTRNNAHSLNNYAHTGGCYTFPLLHLYHLRCHDKHKHDKWDPSYTLLITFHSSQHSRGHTRRLCRKKGYSYHHRDGTRPTTIPSTPELSGMPPFMSAIKLMTAA